MLIINFFGVQYLWVNDIPELSRQQLNQCYGAGAAGAKLFETWSRSWSRSRHSTTVILQFLVAKNGRIRSRSRLRGIELNYHPSTSMF